ncbi:hypothetical protein BKA82DRAFT_4457467 [Pisolithus tinctorius]|nr:hypothetical protein BKA82DRAFT_4457467 [Pisolithus tinctorius]
MQAGSPPPSSRGTPSRRGRSARTAMHTASHSADAFPSEFSNKQPNSFTSCLSIPVEGALPIKPQDDAPSSPQSRMSQQATPGSSKRAPRKSKTNALAALQSHASQLSNDDGNTQDATDDFFNGHSPIAISPCLDLSSVKTSSPRNQPVGSTPRPFGLEDCPVFYPTSDEFKDPMTYIRSISEKVVNYGICKVVPPVGWKMPFVTNTETFRFKTRLQRLNSIEATSRAKVNFLEQLYRFHKQQGKPRVSVPTINHKPLDLWLLRKEVQNLGGYEAVTKNKKWGDLGAILGYRGLSSPTVKTDPHLKTHTNIQSSNSHLSSLRYPSSPPSKTNGVKRSTKMTIQEQSTCAHCPSRDGFGRMPSATGATQPDEDQKLTQEQSCEICQKKNHEDQMLLCDGCDCGFHMFCLDPPLTSIPRGQWFCHTFQARDLEFRRRWWATHPPAHKSPPDLNDPTVTYDEFWRLVQSPNETVEIEYGADVHQLLMAGWASAMPTMETHPLEPASKDPWNLNNMPILSDSLLRYIKSDISGMTVPWTYVGMIFSTFCWHNEDHYTYSVNFQHWGETKTWYGIPERGADLFEAQPDLLFQLVTLMNPKRLTEAGVRVYACNQRAGEFVITFPKAYHAGFNHGLNFNEAVNFALPGWLPYGRDCVQRYREHRKLPVFSHDELLVTITQQSQSIKTAQWLEASLREMTERELGSRRAARAMGITERLEDEDRPEDQYQCLHCKVFCFLSQVICHCKNEVVCVEHAKHLCDHAINQHVLRLRFSDAALQDNLAKVTERAAIPSAWKTKFQRVLSESSAPQLRSLRALLAEGERINYPLPELVSLRKCVNRANEWLDASNTFIIRKQSRKRSRRSRGRPSANESTPPGFDDRDPEVQTLGFDTQEIGALRALAEQAEELRSKALALLKDDRAATDRDTFFNECERLLMEASSVNVYLEEIYEVEKIVTRIHNLLSRARACNLPEDNTYMKALQARQRAGDDWEERARHVLDQPFKTIEELDEFSETDPNVPIDVSIYDRLMSARTKAKDFEKQAKAWLLPDDQGPKPKVSEVMRFVARAEKDFSIPAIRDLKQTAEFALDLENRCEAILRNRYQHRDEVDIFEMMTKWRSYAREHLSVFSLPDILNDVVDATRPEDDLPPNDEYFTCICNTPVRPPPPGAQSDAVQCDHCFARFHGECAANGGSCPFCDHRHWNGAINKGRNWHFCFLPQILLSAPEVTKNYSDAWKQLELIVHRTDRLSAVIGHFLTFASQPGNQRPEYIPQVRHYMRKLYKIQFAVSPSREVSFGLDLAGLHRILAGQPAPVRDWLDGTRCICRGRTPFLLGHRTVECQICNRLYHAGCVFFPIDGSMGQKLHRFECPLCCIRKNRPYAFSEVRVKHFDNQDEDTYETSSKDIIYMTLPRPYTQTLIVELIRYTSGSSEVINCAPPQHSVSAPPLPRPPESGPSASHRHSHTPLPLPTPPTPVYELARQPSTNGHHVPPPPPWCTQWHNITSNPTPTRRSEVPEYPLPPPPLSLSPHSGKKRKFADESPPPEVRGSRSPKQARRLPQTPVLPPASVPARAMQQTLSPSLAMIVSPVDTEPSPRPASSVPFATGPSSSSQRPSNTPPAKPMKLVIPKNK